MSGRIAYLGPEGTFCEEALIGMVGAEAAAAEVPYPSIAACFNAVESGEVAEALVPIENALEGGVSQTLDQLMADAGKGLLITDMFGPSLNPNTGDYSVGVSGFWFENGERAYPVSEVTVAGDIPSMLLRAIPGSDLEIRGSTNAPSLLIDGMSLAGR